MRSGGRILNPALSLCTPLTTISGYLEDLCCGLVELDSEARPIEQIGQRFIAVAVELYGPVLASDASAFAAHVPREPAVFDLRSRRWAQPIRAVQHGVGFAHARGCPPCESRCWTMAAPLMTSKFELPGSVPIPNGAGGGMPRFLRCRVAARGSSLAGDPNASIRVILSSPRIPPLRTRIGLTE